MGFKVYGLFLVYLNPIGPRVGNEKMTLRVNRYRPWLAKQFLRFQDSHIPYAIWTGIGHHLLSCYLGERGSAEKLINVAGFFIE